MSKTIATENAPAAIGPYVQGVDLVNMIITCSSLILMEIRAIMPGLSLMTKAKSPDALRLSGLRDSCNLLNL